ncbi:hypothetical protein I4F81_010530 [Pyropia yezoensis]|uniref:Uncharacterized protein n=1 Tax=Pyropia yezoensis TaxID=2788 RepID=A0ACC3CDW7_PYRYE|nr:hypothetical protein I4F81_010530 [Neopyropia yezoensis]
MSRVRTFPPRLLAALPTSRPTNLHASLPAIRSACWQPHLLAAPPAGWRSPSLRRPMDRKEAALILGLPVGGSPSKAAVREAHRRLMRANHPDSGGSTFVATKVNEAKELLLGGRRGQSVF